MGIDTYPDVAVRLFLSAKDWRKYVRIEQNGTEKGFDPGQLPEN